MKKLVYTACLALGITSIANANSLYVMNFNPCTIYGITQGGMITVPGGYNVIYLSPANVSNPSAAPSGTFTGVTFDYTPSFLNPVFVNAAAPSCTGTNLDCNGTPYCYNWNVNSSTGDITLIFF